jgi:integrating conjugative element protein (TIGR03749 family)
VIGTHFCRLAVAALLCITATGRALANDANEIAPPTERIVWTKTPIPLSLPVGKERIVTFPADVRVGVPPQLGDALRTQSVAGTLYWLARKPFPATRVQIQEIDSGRIYLLDLRADSDATSAAPVEIVERPSAAKDTNGTTPATHDAAQVDYVTLTRYAAQQMYAPKRLLRDPPGVYRAPMRIKRAAALVRGGAVEATPLATWRGGGLYVTAIKLRNVTHAPIVLDPRDLRGQWLAATLQHARLLPEGDEADTTCVYLVSARPFEESL